MSYLRKHVNNTDVAIHILKSHFVPEKDVWKLKVEWWNIGVCHSPTKMNIVERIEVKREDMKNWKAYEWTRTIIKSSTVTTVTSDTVIITST